MGIYLSLLTLSVLRHSDFEKKLRNSQEIVKKVHHDKALKSTQM
jgi:hypothetical protein